MEKLIEILNKFKPDVDFKTADNLVEDKILTSLEMVNLVVEISMEFDVEFSPVDLVPENFKNAQTIMDLIESYED